MSTIVLLKSVGFYIRYIKTSLQQPTKIIIQPRDSISYDGLDIDLDEDDLLKSDDDDADALTISAPDNDGKHSPKTYDGVGFDIS